MKNKFIFLLMLLVGFSKLQAEPKQNPQELIQDVRILHIKDKSTEYYQINYRLQGDDTLYLGGATTSQSAIDDLIQKAQNKYQTVVHDSLLLLPLASEKPWALVNISIGSLRTTPGYASEMMSQTLLGTPLQILDSRKAWVLVKSPDHLITWIEGSTITPLSEQEYQIWRKSKRGIAVVNAGVIYSNLTEEAKPISNFVRGNIFEIIDQKKQQVKVRLPDGKEGWIPQKSIEDLDVFKKNITVFNPSRAIDFSESLLGRPYLWGGLSPFGMDCSGFVHTVFQEQGILLLRNSSQQARYGVEVNKDDYHHFEAGDLLFFRSSPTKEGGVTHVGMYLGNGRLINCAGRVKIDSFEPKDPLYSESLTKRLVGVRHVTGLENNWGITTFSAHPWY